MRSTARHSAKTLSVQAAGILQLGCLAASPLEVQAAIDNGADWVRIPYKLSGALQHAERGEPHIGRLCKAVRYAHERGRRIVLDFDTPSSSSIWPYLRKTLGRVRDAGIDAIILSDPALALYSAIHYRDLPLHFAVQSPLSSNAAAQLRIQLGASRILLPRCMSFGQLCQLASGATVELEVMGFGPGCSLGVPRASGRDGVAKSSANVLSMLSGHGTGNDAVFACAQTDRPTEEDACNDVCYSPGRLSIGVLRQLPQLAEMGIRAVQIEPRIATPIEVAQVTKVWRAAIDKCLEDAEHYSVNPAWAQQLESLRSSR